ncbi:MAG TPA: HAD family hydrolase [Geobacteraceae bacterium]|nr:HAD family hydrolase [Geobacteraceae bacterium]
MFAEIKALVFDLDGTLYVNGDFGREIRLCACRYIAGLKGTTIEEADRLIRETKKRLAAASGVESTLSHACIELGGNLRELHRRFAEEITPEPFLARDERVTNLLLSLGKRFDLSIYTNNNRLLSERIMSAIGVAGLFRRVLTIEDGWRPKPDPEALETVYRLIGRKPAECMFVGDRYDIDLRLPAAMGSTVFLATSVEELLPLNKLLQGEDL